MNDALRTMNGHRGQMDEELAPLTKRKSAREDDNRDHKTNYWVKIVLERPGRFPDDESSRNDAYISKRIAEDVQH